MKVESLNKLDSAVALLIDKVVTGLDSSVTFMEAQLPEYIMQLLLWHALYSGLIWGVCLILVVLAVTWVCRLDYASLITTSERHYYKVWDIKVYLAVWTSGISALLFVSLFINTAWLKIWIAPKVWLVDYPACLIK